MRPAALLILLLLMQTAYAREVTMNFAFNIGGSVNDNIHVNGTNYDETLSLDINFAEPEKKYISADNTTDMFALVFAGSDFRRIALDTDYSATDYMLSMTQSDDNRFLFGFTKGTWRDIDEKAKGIELFRIASRTLGDIILPVPASHTLFVRLQSKFDPNGIEKFASGSDILIKNTGSKGSITNITIEDVS